MHQHIAICPSNLSVAAKEDPSSTAVSNPEPASSLASSHRRTDVTGGTDSDTVTESLSPAAATPSPVPRHTTTTILSSDKNEGRELAGDPDTGSAGIGSGGSGDSAQPRFSVAPPSTGSLSSRLATRSAALESMDNSFDSSFDSSSDLDALWNIGDTDKLSSGSTGSNFKSAGLGWSGLSGKNAVGAGSLRQLSQLTGSLPGGSSSSAFSADSSSSGSLLGRNRTTMVPLDKVAGSSSTYNGGSGSSTYNGGSGSGGSSSVLQSKTSNRLTDRINRGGMMMQAEAQAQAQLDAQVLLSAKSKSIKTAKDDMDDDEENDDEEEDEEEDDSDEEADQDESEVSDQEEDE